MSDDSDRVMLEMVQDLQAEVAELREENRKLRQGLDPDKPDAPPNDEIVEAFFDAKNYAPSSERPNRHAINYYRTHTDDAPLTEATVQSVLDFANNWSGEQQRPKRATILSYLGTLKVMFDWMQAQPWGPDENVVETGREQYKNENKSQIRRSGKHSGTVVQPDEYVEIVRSNMGSRAKSVLVLAAKTGLRRKELVYLKVQDIDLDAKKVYNRSPKGVGDERLPKSDADQKLIDDETVSALEDWLDSREHILGELEKRGHNGRRGDGAVPDSEWLYPNDAGERLTPMTMSRWWNKATERAANRMRGEDDELADKFESMSPHDARRCFTSWLNWNNCPRDVISALRGDADGDMVSLYTQYGEGQVREEYEKAMPTFGL